MKKTRQNKNPEQGSDSIRTNRALAGLSFMTRESLEIRLMRFPLEHDPEKRKPVFPRDKRGTRLRGDHA
ncbi:MAG TPA: hypothetical protein VMU69_15190 [Bradyrhizobium sp.]|nr:hypothetical protein [Bradyrhizobium sp.]